MLNTLILITLIWLIQDIINKSVVKTGTNYKQKMKLM